MGNDLASHRGTSLLCLGTAGGEAIRTDTETNGFNNMLVKLRPAFKTSDSAKTLLNKDHQPVGRSRFGQHRCRVGAAGGQTTQGPTTL
jgi:hypothetical protein